MSEFLPSLDAEIGRLERAVEAIPEVVKLRELRRVRAMYAESETTSRAAQIVAKIDQAISPGRRMSPERQRALDFIAEQLARAVGGPIRTSTLMEMLTGAGIEIGGSDPLNNLSALLSTSGRFIAHGRSGWTLKRGDPMNEGSEAVAAEPPK
jgi:hypothetical protein